MVAILKDMFKMCRPGKVAIKEKEEADTGSHLGELRSTENPALEKAKRVKMGEKSRIK
jgi:hypothetical protein